MCKVHCLQFVEGYEASSSSFYGTGQGISPVSRLGMGVYNMFVSKETKRMIFRIESHIEH